MFPDLFNKVIEFHGHCCPGITYGYRAALAALDEFGQKAVDEELVAIVENDSCSVDAIQVITGCTFGKGNLIFNDYGKQVYTFLNRTTKNGIRISINSCQFEESEEEKDAWKQYSSGNHSQSILKIIGERKKKKIDFLLSLSSSKLLKIDTISMPLPKKASLYQSVICEACSEKVMEPRVRLKDGRKLCIPCYDQ